LTSLFGWSLCSRLGNSRAARTRAQSLQRLGTLFAIGVHAAPSRAEHRRKNMPSAKKSAAKKTAAKKTPAKKSAAKKTAAKKGAAKRPAAGARAAKTDATVLLQRDHADVRKLFREYEKLADRDGEAGERRELATQICAMLTVHATIEEEIFYPAAREAKVEEDMVDEAEVEHASAKDLIAQIQSMSPDDELYDAKVKVLGEYVNHHVEEEEGEMFPKCRRAKMDLAGLAEQLAERRSELMAEMPA
jgi:hemerythrin superfamily protein